MSFLRRRIDQITVTQPPLRPDRAEATRAQLSFDGGPPIPVTLAPGTTRLDVPARQAGRVRLTITGVTEFGDQLRITELGIGNARSAPSSPRQRLRGCVTIGTLDGRPLRATIRGSVGDLDRLEAFDLQACGAALAAGDLRLGPGGSPTSSRVPVSPSS